MTRTDDTREPTSHTPEPWAYTLTAIVQDAQGTIVADCELDPASEQITPSPTQEVANARRICAAVNACKGIGTEALERGVIAELRHVLGEVLTAAGDLDAAIDGATGEFDAERARLTPALRAAQVVLNGAERDLPERLATRRWIASEGEQLRRATPLLLEAVQDCIAQIHALLPAHQQSDSTLDNLPSVLRARAAIAAATAVEGERTLHC